jgi:hypothetical protein
MLDGDSCGSFDSLNVGNGGWFAVRFTLGFTLGFGSGGFLLALRHGFHHHAFQEECDGAFAFCGFAYFGAWGEDA